MTREELLNEQLALYKEQTNELEKDMGDKKSNFSHFRGEIDKLTKKLRKVERDTNEWKEKFEASNEQVSVK